MSAPLALPDSVNYTRRGHTVFVTLNRPDKRNALDGKTVDALLHIVKAAAHDETRLLVLRGEGRSFCAGFDFSGFEDTSEGDLLLRFVRIEQLLQTLHHAPYHTLALAHGPCFGAGVDLICACAARIAAPSTTFRMPGLQFAGARHAPTGVSHRRGPRSRIATPVPNLRRRKGDRHRLSDGDQS